MYPYMSSTELRVLYDERLAEAARIRSYGNAAPQAAKRAGSLWMRLAMWLRALLTPRGQRKETTIA